MCACAATVYPAVVSVWGLRYCNCELYSNVNSCTYLYSLFAPSLTKDVSGGAVVFSA